MSDSSSSEDEIVLVEPDPSIIPFEFLKSGKSELEGVLLTHNASFKYHKGGYNRTGQVQWYVCSNKVGMLELNPMRTVIGHFYSPFCSCSYISY